MDIIVIAIAGLSAPFLVLVVWRVIPPDMDIPLSAARWIRRIGAGPTASIEGDEDSSKQAASGGVILSQHEPARDEIVQPTVAVANVTRIATRDPDVSAAPKSVKRSRRTPRSASKKAPDVQWPDSEVGQSYIRPSSEQACPRCQDSASRGAAYCQACGRKLGTGATEPNPVRAAGAERVGRSEARPKPSPSSSTVERMEPLRGGAAGRHRA
jgi:hypothetical protein